ncbi:uncharacterized protein LOC127286986 isoform X2 [Leptopilina boulardi]|uniref:uncharacterized protein LOC127286986 isoform X2 n=1 Tax=Leptopilina boulardi TaxID=63433 RepID=UPI0021F5364C|nr:uncharacterized protein LOC127286986 isoform X2 [Leptopilina boulardi]
MPTKGLIFMSMHIARAKLNVLTNEFPHVSNELQLRRCIQLHQEVIWFVNLLNSTSRYLILKQTLAVFLYLTLGFFQLLHQKDVVNPFLIHQFLLVIIVVNYRVYFGTQCADAVTLVGENLRFSIPWAGQSLRSSKSMCIVIQRCQKPLIISVSGIIAQYSCWYYGSFLYRTFSYFLTLKAVLGL